MKSHISLHVFRSVKPSLSSLFSYDKWWDSLVKVALRWTLSNVLESYSSCGFQIEEANSKCGLTNIVLRTWLKQLNNYSNNCSVVISQVCSYICATNLHLSLVFVNRYYLICSFFFVFVFKLFSLKLKTTRPSHFVLLTFLNI